MKTKDLLKQMVIYKNILEEKGYDVIYIGLYGSQNYNLDDKQSDVDVKAIVTLSLEQIIKRDKISLTIKTENGDIDVKDLLTYYEVVRKGNFSFIEAMQTEYSIGDKSIKELFKNIPVNLKSIKGAMYEKKKAFRHEYPSKKEEFAKWGFDPKQLHHIIRLAQVLKSYRSESNESYISLDGAEKSYMLDIKRNRHNVIEKMELENDIDEIIKSSEKYIPKNYKYEPVDLSSEINKYILDKIKASMFNSESCRKKDSK